MKNCYRIVMILVILSISYVHAQGWESVFRSLVEKDTGIDTIESGQMYETKFYEADVRFIIIDGDGNANNFSTNGDIIDIQILNADLSYRGDRDGLTQFAEENGQAIYDALFPSDAAAAAAGVSDAQFLQANIAQVAFAAPVVSNRTDEGEGEKQQAKNIEEKITRANNSFLARLEFSFGTIGAEDDNIYSITAVPSYGYNFGEYLQHSIGFFVPLRYSNVNDAFDNELFSFSLVPYVKFNLFSKDGLILAEDYFSIDAGLQGLFTTTFIANNILGGYGNMRYGGGVFTSVNWQPVRFLIARLGLSYQISQVFLPDFLTDELDTDEFDWIVESLNDTPLDHEFSVGINFTVPITDEFSVSLDYLRTMSLSSKVRQESDSPDVSYIGVIFNYLLADFLDLSIGYKTTLEIEDFTEHSLLLGGLFRF